MDEIDPLIVIARRSAVVAGTVKTY